MRKGIRIYLLTIFILSISVSSCMAQIPKIRSTISKGDVIKTFWITGKKLIGVIGGHKLLAIDTNGKILWQKELTKKYYVTKDIKVISFDDKTLISLSGDGTKIWEKQINENPINVNEGADGIYAITYGNFNSSEINIFSEQGEPLWTKSINQIQPIAILPEGKGLIGMHPTQTAKGIAIQIIRPSKEPQTIVDINNAAFLESPDPIIAINPITKQTLVASGTTPWWAIISNSGEVVLSQNQIPVLKTDYIVPCGSGFAFASSVGNKVVLISGQGKILWEKKFDKFITGLAGNASYLAVSIGNEGQKGKLFLYSKEGNLEGMLEVPISLSAIEFEDSSNLIAGMSEYVNVQLFDFGK